MFGDIRLESVDKFNSLISEWETSHSKYTWIDDFRIGANNFLEQWRRFVQTNNKARRTFFLCKLTNLTKWWEKSELAQIFTS